MKKYTLLLIALPIIALGGFYAYSKHQVLNVGATIPISTAFFETSLANKITSTADTMTLVSATTKDGTTLSGFYAFVIDEGLASEEMVNATCSGTACTGMTRGLSAINGTTTVAALRFEHRRGASVKITDAPQLLILSRIMNGDETVPNALRYTSDPTWTYGLKQLVSWDKAKEYADGLAIAGAPDADLVTKGIVEMGTQAENVASTQLGSTGAWLAQASNYATNTPNTATRNNVDIWSGATGYLAQGWLNLTEAFTWTGAHIFSALATFNGGLTSTATTTLSGSSLTNNAIVINGLAYQWPSANVSNVLKNDGNGNLSWGRPSKYSWSIDPTDAEDGAWSTTTLGTIPANTLTASSTISISQAGSSQPYNGGAYTIYIRTSTGETLFAHTCAGGTNSANTLCTSTGLVTFISATSQKYSSEGMSHLATGANGALDGGVGTASIDFTQEKTLEIVLKGDGSGDARMTSVSVVINP